jgi:citrate lyase beta subunit
MTGIELFQCIPAYKPSATARLIKSLFDFDCKILLDIEDSIQDVQNPDQTSILKQTARNDFEEIINLLPDKKFSLRINPIRGSEFQHDIYWLDKFSDKIETVFIPKVESSNDISAFYAVIPHGYKLNLIVETQKGIENLEEILSSPFKENIDYVFFGNYDYHLDNNIYPIIEQHSLRYWKIVEPLISKVESHQIKFGNSPYANIADKPTLDFSLLQLTKLCKANFALVSLHKEQTRHFKKLIYDWQISLAKANAFQKNGFTLSSFTQHRQKGRSFSFADNRIITPQEYLLALRKQNG